MIKNVVEGGSADDDQPIFPYKEVLSEAQFLSGLLHHSYKSVAHVKAVIETLLSRHFDNYTAPRT